MTVPPRTGTAFVLCAPSGAGKTTLVKRLIEKFDRLTFSISCTTRAPREGEVDGRDYHFMEKHKFLALVEEEYFAEWAEVHGNYYGTPMQATRDLLAAGKDVLFDVDVQGATQLEQSLPEAFFAFILPPSKDELERRLRKRQTEDEAAIALRLSNAATELKEADWFDVWIINDDQEQAFEDLCAAYRAACLNPSHRAGFLENLLGQF
ncbi:MAG: guanylate kinase [Deltaproteobacteria bacterium]|jgi:guanylate kinase|nr:guanylate kinase [Deltaproteobacteria bacterium]